ncbi:hypothetical protein C8J56DRAFT_893796 [Mycena floridula]|nr:hypothetical protein C8J56DRAFT_893796 [Mycena floridula]
MLVDARRAEECHREVKAAPVSPDWPRIAVDELVIETPSPERPQQRCNDAFFANHLEFGAKLLIQDAGGAERWNETIKNRNKDREGLLERVGKTILVQHPANLSHPRVPNPLGAMSAGVALDGRKMGGDGDSRLKVRFRCGTSSKSTKLVHGAYDYGGWWRTFHSSQQEERLLLVFFYSTNTLPPDFAGCKLYDVLASKGDGRELGSGTTKQPSSSTLLMGAGLILMLVSAERTKREPLMRYYLHLVSDLGLPTTTKQFELVWFCAVSRLDSFFPNGLDRANQFEVWPDLPLLPQQRPILSSLWSHCPSSMVTQ